MKEWITGRNPVYETLRARRRTSFRLQVASGVEEKGRLVEILKLAAAQKVPVTRVQRQVLDSLSDSHQGVALETSCYPYSTLPDILDCAAERQEPLFVLALDLLQNPQNLGTLMRTAEAVGVHGILIPLRRAAGITRRLSRPPLAPASTCWWHSQLAQRWRRQAGCRGMGDGLEGSPVPSL